MRNRNRLLLETLFTGALLLLSLHSIDAGVSTVTWEQLQEEGAIIAGIQIEIQNVFPAEEPESRYWFARTANRLHVKTKEHVVQRELLFKIGDKVNAVIIHACERSLRKTLDIARDAVIVPERVEGKKVWARVILKDAWSLGVAVSYDRVGRDNYRFMINERNLLGFGKGLLISHEQSFERSSNEIAYYDPQLFGSLWTLNTNYQQLSDGSSRFLAIDRPFYSVHTTWAFQLKATDTDETLTLYDHSRSVYAVHNKNQSINLTAAWAYRTMPDTAYRVGAGLVFQQMKYFDLMAYDPDYPFPLEIEDHRLRGPTITWEWFQDRYRDFGNLQSIGRMEQYNLGRDLNLSAGYYSRFLGSLQSGPFFLATVTKGWLFGEDTLLLEKGSMHGRLESSSWRNTFLANEITFYNRSFPWQTLAGNLRLDLALRPDLENWLYLGGQEGLRGYPAHFLAGDQRWLLNLEDRIITNRTLWGLLQEGYVAFMDAGAIHNFGTDTWGKTYVDIGLGLRFGNIRARAGSVIELTISVPLVKGPGSSGYEIVAGNVMRF